MNREWALPLLLGLLAAAALWSVPHGPKEGGDGGNPASTQGPAHSATATSSASGIPPIVLPFGQGTGVDGGNLTFLVLAPHGKAAALADVNRSIDPSQGQRLQWQEPEIAFYTQGTTACKPAGAACDPAWAFGYWPLPRSHGVLPETRPLLGVDGYNGTRITVHVFDETGLLAATNAPENETYLFDGGSHPQQLPGGVWYVGANATAPNGTQPIPATARPLFQQLLPLMRGLPVGGVASVRSDAYASVYGPLYVTVRIDGLAYAP